MGWAHTKEAESRVDDAVQECTIVTQHTLHEAMVAVVAQVVPPALKKKIQCHCRRGNHDENYYIHMRSDTEECAGTAIRRLTDDRPDNLQYMSAPFLYLQLKE